MKKLISKIQNKTGYKEETLEALKNFLKRSGSNSKILNFSLNVAYSAFTRLKRPRKCLPFVWKNPLSRLHENGIQHTDANGKTILNNCTILAIYNEQGIIPDYVVNFLVELKKVSTCILLIADNQLANKEELKKIEGTVDVAIFGRHSTYDFGSWKIGLAFLSKAEMLGRFDYLTLTNDSIYGPFTSLSEIYSNPKLKKADFWGLLDSHDTQYHLLSFFLVFSKKVFCSQEFKEIFSSIGEKLSFKDAVYTYERKLTEFLSKKFTSEVLFKDYCFENWRSFYAGNQNPTVWPLALLRDGFPFIKVKALTGGFGSDLKESGTDALNYIRINYPRLGELIARDLERRQCCGVTVGREGYTAANLLFDSIGKDPSFAIADAKVVSFDVFDTLLSRPFVEPTDLFLYIETIYKRNGFARERVQAEKRARIKSLEEDITLEEIYKEVKPKFRDLLNTELECEQKFLFSNEQGKKLYDAAVKAGKKIVCVSDMYLPSNFISSILKSNGFDKIDKVFVSGELKKTKGSGALFKELIKDFGEPPASIVHFGDNQIADFEVPRSLGIKAFRINKYIENYFNSPSNFARSQFYVKNPSLVSSIYSSLVARKSFGTFFHSYWRYFGYAYGGPLALAYVSFISREAKLNGIEKLLFVSRDGFALKEVFDNFFNEDRKITSEYVYLSRAVGLQATLDYANDSGYLRSLLTLFFRDTGEIKPTDSFEVNQVLYSKNFNRLKEWSKPCHDAFLSHLTSKTKESKKVAVVDMTTGLFSSLQYAKGVLGDRIITGFFTGSFRINEDLNFDSFSPRRFEARDDLALKLSELLISSPEKPVLKLEGLGTPVFGSEDSIRPDVYPEILEGILAYCKDFIGTFGADHNLFFSMDNWLSLAQEFCIYCNEQDLSFLEKVSDSPEIDNTRNSKSLASRIRVNRASGCL